MNKKFFGKVLFCSSFYNLAFFRQRPLAQKKIAASTENHLRIFFKPTFRLWKSRFEPSLKYSTESFHLGRAAMDCDTSLYSLSINLFHVATFKLLSLSLDVLESAEWTHTHSSASHVRTHNLPWERESERERETKSEREITLRHVESNKQVAILNIKSRIIRCQPPVGRSIRPKRASFSKQLRWQDERVAAVSYKDPCSSGLCQKKSHIDASDFLGFVASSEGQGGRRGIRNTMSLSAT